MRDLQDLAEQLFDVRNRLLSSQELHRLLWEIVWQIAANEEDAQDLFGEAMLMTACSLHLYVPGEGNFSTFVYNRIRPKLISYHNRQRSHLSLNDECIAADNEQNIAFAFDEIWGDDKSLGRRVAYLRLVEGCNFTEISERLRVPRRDVKSAYAAAMARLKEILRDESGTTDTG